MKVRRDGVRILAEACFMAVFLYFKRGAEHPVDAFAVSEFSIVNFIEGHVNRSELTRQVAPLA